MHHEVKQFWGEPKAITEPENVHYLLEHYSCKQEDLEYFRRMVDTLLYELLRSRKLEIHKIESRVKSLSSLEEKIKRKGYASPTQITDIVGIRLICYLEDETVSIAEMIEEEFEIDLQNSINQTQLKRHSREFGYQSIHYVVRLNDKRKKLPEWAAYSETAFEIQVRTILQHAWASIEHMLQYKSLSEVPAHFSRDFLIISALLEDADHHFQNLKHLIEKQKIDDSNNFEQGFLDRAIDRSSVVAFLETPLVKYWTEQALQAGYRPSGETDMARSPATTSLLEFLEKLEITNISALNTYLNKLKGEGEAFLSQLRKEVKPSIVLNAVPQYLIQHLLRYAFRNDPKVFRVIEQKSLGQEVRQNMLDILGLQAPEAHKK
ncbi:hypothetical protein COW36_02130 [bacterium (Candidatus Blackallbacteria) CG17_big_fil_post_rev_8_21_14_2_50_48_46]|uniref:RelA/SpoT domain-containing protein n=1 Tax=bacterium (Candidatus Blackallbacteria) CG17_big_fil_post_rev_8_21_14_2_50_48_46 TaxID=2014261 RepID=A0A2M7GAQ1_9BACT|nr:MAG: hypothetical protein COW64_26520 [bacterium (Candidatus Blackallbacteria) CG18_big_fil_WC_8_21_14_2_50_49_26]PIW19231.1 MAG: hypothetical protein COW36_02130 [bacterium (Candidatus Blackallbacteria) CG17_big_fil_post_rev_8_21_14_2_50_48_46]PIW45419.1 MAG: hypothetical protein COW20_20010 [bacterium (Candidatus Blackallbacteria) CG13_big_fil_rev_8_21_14_2_50_49_14]